LKEKGGKKKNSRPPKPEDGSEIISKC
jgi:hypothetical protein